MDGPRHGGHKLGDCRLLPTTLRFGWGALSGQNPKFPVMDRLIETDSFHELHREVILSLVNPYLEDGHDVWMVQLRRRFCFDSEALHGRRRCKLARADHLQRHQPVQTELASLVDNSHPSAPDLLQQFVIAEVIPLTATFGKVGSLGPLSAANKPKLDQAAWALSER